jgi:hypothetical protein
MSTAQTPTIWKSLPTKLRAYEGIYWLNRSFEATLLSLERLERLGMFRLESINEFRVRLEHTRAEANEELVDTLQQYEMDESVRFDCMERELGKQRADPDDVFFAARDRKQEIKDQIRGLQKALNRHRRGRGTRKTRRRK